jgi:hypothetical protein
MILKNILRLVLATENYDSHVPGNFKGPEQVSVLKKAYESQLNSIVKVNTSLLVELDKLTHIYKIIYRPITGERLKVIHNRIDQFSRELKFNIDFPKNETFVVTSLPVVSNDIKKVSALIKQELSEFKKVLVPAVVTKFSTKFALSQTVLVQHFEDKNEEIQKCIS